MTHLKHTIKDRNVSRRAFFKALPLAAPALILSSPAKAAVSARIALAGPTTFHVSPFGDNAADGITEPWETIQHAWDTLLGSYDLAGFDVTIQLAPGEYSSGLTGRGRMVGQAHSLSILVQGDKTNPYAYFIYPIAGNPFSAAYGAMYSISGMLLSADNADHIAAGPGGHIEVHEGIVFGNAGPQVHMTAGGGGIIIVRRPGYTITGSAQAHMSAGLNGMFYFDTDGLTGLLSVTTLNMPTFVAAFAVAHDGGIINCQGIAFNGGAYGPTYLVKSNGVITTGNPNPNYFPGLIAGTVSSGGQYI